MVRETRLLWDNPSLAPLDADRLRRLERGEDQVPPAKPRQRPRRDPKGTPAADPSRQPPAKRKRNRPEK